MKRVIVLAFTVTGIVSCQEGQSVKAKIFERRQLGSNRLMIHYRYQVGSAAYVDSASVTGVVINTDSISVIFNVSNPAKAIPDFSR